MKIGGCLRNKVGNLVLNYLDLQDKIDTCMRGERRYFFIKNHIILSRTPLMLAVMNGHRDSVMLLLDQAANPNAVDVNGRTSAHRGVSITSIFLILRYLSLIHI